jgi:putative endonuclease
MPSIGSSSEFHDTMAEATLREKRIKKWRMVWKLKLTEEDNPSWGDLYDEIL